MLLNQSLYFAPFFLAAILDHMTTDKKILNFFFTHHLGNLLSKKKIYTFLTFTLNV